MPALCTCADASYSPLSPPIVRFVLSMASGVVVVVVAIFVFSMYLNCHKYQSKSNAHEAQQRERERVGERSLTWKALRSYVFSALDTLRCQRQQFELNFLSLSFSHMHSAQATKCSVIKLNSYELCSLFLLYSIYVCIYTVYTESCLNIFMFYLTVLYSLKWMSTLTGKNHFSCTL